MILFTLKRDIDGSGTNEGIKKCEKWNAHTLLSDDMDQELN